MIAVLIDVVGEAFSPWVSNTGMFLIFHTDFEANDSIRASSAKCLSGLVRWVKKFQGITPELPVIGRTFTDALANAMASETETDSLIAQVNAIANIIDEIGQSFLTREELRELGDKCFSIVNKSLERVTENNQADKNWAAQKEDDDEDFDDEDYALVKEENNKEFDL
jgi:hypothetical protein